MNLQIFGDLLAGGNRAWVFLGCTLLGISAGVLGSFAFLRRRSLMGDALAHAALPGVCVAYLLTGSRELAPLLVGAVAAGLIGAGVIQAVTRGSRIKEDAALGLVLSVFYGFGIVLLTFIQHSGRGNQAGLDRFIFGQAASLVVNDVRTMAICALVVCAAAMLLFKEFKLLCFDPEFGRGIGYPVGLLDGVLLLLIVLAVVIGLQAVGVVLMAALLITPAAAARFWTDRLGAMTALSALIGGATGAAGAAVSAGATGLPTGPLIVLSATAFFLFSLLFAPRRGVAARAIRILRLRRRVARENSLRSLYELAEAAGDWDLRLTAADLAGHRLTSAAQVERNLRRLDAEGLLNRTEAGYQLTELGLKTAYEVVRNHRLWEIFLMHEGQLASDHVDRDADLIEHHLEPETVQELERLLRLHGRQPGMPHSVHPIPAESKS